MTPKQLKQFRDQLNQLKIDLLSSETAGEASAATVELDQTRVGRLSRMDALQAQAMSQDAQRRRRAKLRGVDKAMLRLDNDDYGHCDDCGEDIIPARLTIDPTVTLCVACAGKRE